MQWSELYAFMLSRVPTLAEQVVGVPCDQIAELEQGLGIRLPRFYVGFLATMGVDSGSFVPFTSSHEHDFYDLVEALPPDYYPPHDFFKVAYECNEGRTPMYDYFLDLRRSDGEDAPLVLFEDGIAGFTAEMVGDLGTSLAEELASGAWEMFEGRARPHDRILMVHANREQAIEGARGRVLALLEHHGVVRSLPALPRLDCLMGPLVGRVEVRDSMMMVVTIAGDDAKQIGYVIEQMLDHVPGASLDPRRPCLSR